MTNNKPNPQQIMKKNLGIVIMMFLLFPGSAHTAVFPFSFTDSAGNTISIEKPPQRVVSLVPSITEALLRICAEEVVHGITYHSVLPPQSSAISAVGGFFNPDLDKVAALEPDLIFYADLQQGVRKRFNGRATMVELTPTSIDEGFAQIRLLGRLFNKEKEAAKIINRERQQLQVIADKVDKIPQEKRQRVMRLMGRDTIMAPGDDSFQNEFIRAAGGIAPTWHKNGSIVPVTLEQWQEFNPQILYGCGGDRSTMSILDQPEWNEVDAIKNNKVFFFPCDLTCRAATHTGYFVSWLAARIYNQEFGDEHNFVLAQEIISTKKLALDLDYVQKAEIIETNIKDFRNKTVAVTFKHPMTVVSTLEGQRQGITTVANHYFPPPSWGLGHRQGIEALRQETLQTLHLPEGSTSILFTGADMDNLSVATQRFKEMQVTALVTAGVSSNSVRMSKDTGSFYEPEQAAINKPGTINIMLLTNMQLSPRAMTRALISATEAKSAVLQDLDIRSSYSPRIYQATGTGTDNIIVVQGEGYPIDSTGGHTKMGELIARAVYAGVREAVHQQNGLTAQRSIFQRLKERKISLHDLCNKAVNPQQAPPLRAEMEHILLEPRYADFLKAILTVSDDVERGIIEDTSSIDAWIQATASELAGGRDAELKPFIQDNLPQITAKGLAALLAGAQARMEK